MTWRTLTTLGPIGVVLACFIAEWRSMGLNMLLEVSSEICLNCSCCFDREISTSLARLSGHDLDISGVFATSPRDAPGPGERPLQFLCFALKGAQTSQTGCPHPVVFRESVTVGETRASPEEVQQIVQSLGDSFRGTSYHLLQRNCNHFSDMLCERLTGQQAPLWVYCRP